MSQLPLFQVPSYTVSEITRYLRELLESDEVLQDVWVQGEISNLSRPSSGHIYFTLKDGTASLRCVVWKSTAIRLRIGLQNGLAVEAHGGVGIYERDGQYQLYIDSIRPAGEGLLFQEFMRLKNRLEAEGLFDPERKRPIPERPACIGIVTSPTGAALQDMLNTLKARYPLAEVILAPCSVQGDAAPHEIASALNCLQQSGEPDVIIVARGGGSLEDLWAFNDELVVRAIAHSPIPVITGIGHETDFTLADFAADLRAPTPTGAAVLATPDRADLLSALLGVQDRLNNAALMIISRRWQDLDLLQQRLNRASPGLRLNEARQAVDDLYERGLRALRHNLQLRRAHLNGLRSRLTTLNPRATLERGFAIVEREDGSLLKSVRDVRPGDQINVQLWDGKIVSRVENIQADQRPDTASANGDQS